MQNKPKAELTAALMLLDTRSMSFDMQEIDNRRFMFSPQTGELILGRQYRGGQLYKSHAEEHFDSGGESPFRQLYPGLDRHRQGLPGRCYPLRPEYWHRQYPRL